MCFMENKINWKNILAINLLSQFTERDIYLSLVKIMKKPLITKSVKKNAAIFTVVLFIGYLIFNFFSVLQINYFFIDNIYLIQISIQLNEHEI